MTHFYKKSTVNTPEINFDPSQGLLTISGKSYPENVFDSYHDLLVELEEYASQPQAKTQVDFDWLYYNTATTKMIVKILSILDVHNTELTVNWYVKEGFDMMHERANLIAEVLGIKILIKKG